MSIRANVGAVLLLAGAGRLLDGFRHAGAGFRPAGGARAADHGGAQRSRAARGQRTAASGGRDVDLAEVANQPARGIQGANVSFDPSPAASGSARLVLLFDPPADIAVRHTCVAASCRPRWRPARPDCRRCSAMARRSSPMSPPRPRTIPSPASAAGLAHDRPAVPRRLRAHVRPASAGLAIRQRRLGQAELQGLVRRVLSTPTAIVRSARPRARRPPGCGRPPASGSAGLGHRLLQLRQQPAHSRMPAQGQRQPRIQHRPHPGHLLAATLGREFAGGRERRAVTLDLLPQLRQAGAGRALIARPAAARSGSRAR